MSNKLTYNEYIIYNFYGGMAMAKLYFRYGAMGSGKTSALLQAAYNYEEQGLKVLLFKPDIDTKGDDKVTSRIGLERKVDAKIKENDNIYDIIANFEIPDIIIVDEAQFLTPIQVEDLFYYTKEFDVPVMCYGLRSNFKLEGFPGSIKLLLLAEDIKELKAICKCGSKATINMRLINSIPTFEGDSVLIDGSEDNVTYKGICGNCYTKIRKRSV